MARERWIADLRKAGLNIPEDRLGVVAEFRVSNHVTSFRRMRAAGDPSCWPGYNLLFSDEADFLARKAKWFVPRKASRSRSREPVRHLVEVPASQASCLLSCSMIAVYLGGVA